MSRESYHASFSWPEKGNLDGIGADEIVEGLFLAGERPGADREFARMLGIRVVLCCNADRAWPQYAAYDATTATTRPIASHPEFVAELQRLGGRTPDGDPVTLIMNIAADDATCFDLTPWFPASCEVLETAGSLRARALVHCMAGVSRSATIVAARLMQHTGLSVSEVVGYMRERRRIVNPNPGFVNQLERWDLTGYLGAGAAVDASLDETIARMVSRLAQSRLDKFRAYLSAMMTSAHLAADRRMVGPLIVRLHNANYLPTRELVEQVLDVARRAFENDEAVDTPQLPSQCVEMLAAINRAFAEEEPSAAAGVVSASDLEELFAALVSGMGDQFGFSPEAAACFLSAVAQQSAVLPAFNWIHLVAGRLRSILDSCTPLAFPPSIKPPFPIHQSTDGEDPADAEYLAKYPQNWEPDILDSVRVQVLWWCTEAIAKLTGCADAPLVASQLAQLQAACGSTANAGEITSLARVCLVVIGVSTVRIDRSEGSDEKTLLELAESVVTKCA